MTRRGQYGGVHDRPGIFPIGPQEVHDEPSRRPNPWCLDQTPRQKGTHDQSGHRQTRSDRQRPESPPRRSWGGAGLLWNGPP
eukprot:5671364-Pyramimonas_sp.AAC.2